MSDRGPWDPRVTAVLPTSVGDHAFCPHCGAPTPQRLCAQCQAPNGPGAHFCATCGAALPETEAALAAGSMTANGGPEVAETPPAKGFGAGIKRAFGQPGTPAYRRTSLFVLVLVYVSVASIVFESIQQLNEALGPEFAALDLAITLLFTVEYIANIYAAPDRMGYVLSMWGIIDLVAIVPTFVSTVLGGPGVDLRVLRILRTLRLLRILKITRMLRAGETGKAPTPRSTLIYDLQVVSIAAVCLITISATLLYFAEGDIDGTSFPHIPAGMWWAIQTIAFSAPSVHLAVAPDGSTVLANASPVTAIGRGVAVATMFSSIGLLAYLIGAVARAMAASAITVPLASRVLGREQRV